MKSFKRFFFSLPFPSETFAFFKTLIISMASNGEVSAHPPAEKLIKTVLPQLTSRTPSKAKRETKVDAFVHVYIIPSTKGNRNNSHS